MAKANLILPDGTTVNIEGTADEVAILLEKFSQQNNPNLNSSPTKKKRRSNKTKSRSANTKIVGPTALIKELVDEDFFKSKRTLKDIQKKLEERGHIYAITSISPQLTKLTRSGTIRRIKENNKWVYVV
jgi:hypothetical protein